MRVIVCIKQVPDTTNVRINPETNTLVREGVASIINPFDVYAIEEAVRIREKHGGTVTVHRDDALGGAAFRSDRNRPSEPAQGRRALRLVRKARRRRRHLGSEQRWQLSAPQRRLGDTLAGKRSAAGVSLYRSRGGGVRLRKCGEGSGEAECLRR